MKSRPFPFPLFQISSAFILLILLSSASDQWFLNCTDFFNCNTISRMEFHLWRNEGTESCGPPETIKLNCHESRATIEIFGAEYELVGFNTQDQIFLIAENYFSYSFCSQDTSSSNIYGIIHLSDYCGQPDKATDCSESGSRLSYLPLDQSKTTANGDPYCKVSTVVYISPVLFKEVGDLQKFEQRIRAKFESRPKVDGLVCRSCSVLGGVCGYDFLSDRTTCFCKSPSNGFQYCYSNTIIQEYHSSRSGKSVLLKKILIIQVAFASGCIMLIISVVIFIYYTRKSISKNNDVEEVIKRYSTQTPKRYSYSKLKKVTNSFKNKLGQGRFSTVYKGKLPSGRDVAVKLLNDEYSKDNGQDFMNEVVSITKTSHINIVTLLGFCYEQNKRALIYEYMPKGSLDKYVSQKAGENEIKLDLNTLYNIVIGIARGLEYLHCGCNTRIVHFDIKPHNILLDNEFCPKISDFGLAKQCGARESHVSMTGMKGTIGFMAPEVMFRSFGKVSHKSDVYSFGMLVLTMVGERRNSMEGVDDQQSTSEDCFPFWIYNDLIQINEIDDHELEEEMAIRKMIIVGLHCIQTLPDDRPSMSDVVAMLEGSNDGLEIPPKPTLFGPPALP